MYGSILLEKMKKQTEYLLFPTYDESNSSEVVFDLFGVS